MTPINAFKKWILNSMVPYMEGGQKQANNARVKVIDNESYSDLNEDTEYL
tara:strand:+ start:353 stop:502 length:150 start_codon:yes stop_codon:yes gene_type:complete